MISVTHCYQLQTWQHKSYFVMRIKEHTQRNSEIHGGGRCDVKLSFLWCVGRPIGIVYVYPSSALCVNVCNKSKLSTRNRYYRRVTRLYKCKNWHECVTCTCGNSTEIYCWKQKCKSTHNLTDYAKITYKDTRPNLSSYFGHWQPSCCQLTTNGCLVVVRPIRLNCSHYWNKTETKVLKLLFQFRFNFISIVQTVLDRCKDYHCRLSRYIPGFIVPGKDPEMRCLQNNRVPCHVSARL